MKFSEEIIAIFNKLFKLYFDNSELFIKITDSVECPIYLGQFSRNYVEIGCTSIDVDFCTFISLSAEKSCNDTSNIEISVLINERDDQDPPNYSLEEAERILEDDYKETVVKKLSEAMVAFFNIPVINDAMSDIPEDFKTVLEEVSMTVDTVYNKLVNLTKTYEYLLIMLESAKESKITFNTAKVSFRFLERRLLDIKTMWNIYYNVASMLEDGINIKKEDLNLLKLRIER